MRKRIQDRRDRRAKGTRKLRLDALQVARGLVGVMESGGNNRGKAVEKIIRANGGTGPEPWCGDFVSYCYRRAGSKAVQRAWAAVRYLGYLGGMRVVKEARAGMIVCYNFPGGDPTSDHTGIFVAYCNKNGTPVSRKRATHIRAIEGNTGATGAVSDSKTGGDGVYVKIRPLNLVNRFVKVMR